ncbi:MAG: extracellular solute-binding protein [Deltaproteobacteria bacterium]|nr:extracellular solute-binding protein [Deltaproteobacteria bacterium]
MKRVAVLTAMAAVVLFCLTGVGFSQTIENEFYLITPVSKDVHDPVLKAFAVYAKKKWNVDLKTSAMPQGTPVAYGQIIEWKGKPRADVFWGGEGTLFDNLAKEGLLDRIQLPDKLWNEIPAEIGKPIGLPLKDPKRFWVGTMLEPYGIIYQPKLLKRLGVEIKDWEDLLNPKLKGQIAQCTPDRSSSSHASYEVILATNGWEKGWDWLRKLAANTGIFTARSRDVPNVVSKGEFAVGFAVPSYMAFAEVLNGYDVKFVYPRNAYVTPEPMAALKGAPHPKAAHAFIEFMLSEEGQKLVSSMGVYPVTPKYKVQGPPGSNQEKAVAFTSGIRSFFDFPVGNVYNDDIAGAKKRIEEVNSFFRKEIAEKHKDIIKK